MDVSVFSLRKKEAAPSHRLYLFLFYVLSLLVASVFGFTAENNLDQSSVNEPTQVTILMLT